MIYIAIGVAGTLIVPLSAPAIGEELSLWQGLATALMLGGLAVLTL
ncbi:hypothetical protein GCM10011415_23950 [Salipiger pallidus]|uniref:Uncharacterized protein n=1 Tax=Salipiger pallidus TaxID=1775170 RepID=A0A8J2ZK94_9RHOB|nr:hypothetical protein [Salipiger pallidus]GGG74681.1 hypothetical protein GCM10011415_23950 [Salipiger pallidus]